AKEWDRNPGRCNQGDRPTFRGPDCHDCRTRDSRPTSGIPGRVRTVLEAGTTEPYDLVLADPPYADDMDLHVLAGWTRPGTVVVLERSVRTADPDWPTPLEPLRVKKYGDTALHWATHPEE
ncbi:RsmD family RNA methyltransferase, partial [Kibdelosporangium lantanae]